MTPSFPSSGGADQDLKPGEIVGEYEVEGKLGQGGFGAVFKAVHPLIGKQVAIKVLSHRFSVDPQMVSRFIAEARAVNQIRHPNIIDIFSFKTLDDGRLYYVMEYLDGEPLDRRLSRRGPMSLAEAIPVLRGIARALDAAHAKGIAHRDLKAENVFLANHPDGVFPKLLDFGIAKLLAPEDGPGHKTRTGAPMGTPHYMSPEQCRGRDVDHRTDMYAFGVLAYLMLTGVYPLDGDDYMAILMRQIHDDPEPPSAHRPELPVGVNAAIGWLMRKDPASRPETLMAAVRMLEQVVSGGDIDTVPPPPSSDALPTLSGQGQATPGKLRPIPPSGEGAAPSGAPSGPTAKPTPAGGALGASGPTPPPGATPASLASSGSRTPAGLPVAAVSGLGGSGELPAVAPPRGESAGSAGEPAAERRPTTAQLIGGVAVIAAVVIVAVIAIRSGGRDSQPAPPAPTAPAVATAPAAPADAVSEALAPADGAPGATPGGTPARPAEVTITIDGTPPDTEVRRLGVLVGVAPGPVQLPRSESEVLLVLSADGYVPTTLRLTPSEDLQRTVKLAARAGAGQPGTKPGGGVAKPGGGVAKPGGGVAKPGGGVAKPGGGSAKGSSAGGGSGDPSDEILTFPPPPKPAPPKPAPPN